MVETYRQQLARVRRIANGTESSWELSASQRGALEAVLAAYDRYRRLIAVLLEDKLAAAVRLAMPLLWNATCDRPFVGSEAAYRACKAALAAHEAFLAESRALKPKEEEEP